MPIEEITIERHRCQVFEPPRPRDDAWSLLFLHDADARGLEGQAALLELFSQYGLACIAPLSGRSWWTQRIWPGFDSQLSTERYLIDHVLPYAADRWKSPPPQLAIMGIGMGGQGALRLSFKYPARLPIVAAIAPAIDYQLFYYDDEETALREIYADPESARQDTATLHVHPLNWPRNVWFSADPQAEPGYASADRLKMKLSALGIPHDADLETSALGQTTAYADLVAPQAIAFIVDRLQREQRRV